MPFPTGRQHARRQRFPHARRHRRFAPHIAGAAVASAAIALAVVLVIPTLAPHGLAGADDARIAGQVSGQEPRSSEAGAAAPAGSTAPTPPVTGDEPAATAASGTPTPTRKPPNNGTPELPLAPGAARFAPAEQLTGYAWPVKHPRVTLPFGPTPWGSRVVDGELFHDGIDIATFCSDRILAAHDGVVLAAGRHYDDHMGWVGSLEPYYRRLNEKKAWSTLPIVVVIDDGNGYRSVYAHMWRLYVQPGDTVQAGDVLGLEGMTGRASGCHVHYGLFAPLETATFGIRPSTVEHMKLPPYEIARVDPFLVLPPKPGINAPATPKPSPKASPTPAP